MSLFFLSSARANDVCALDKFDATQLRNQFGRYTAKVIVDSTRYDGTVEHDEGTGYLARFDGYVVTAKHIVADPSNFKDQVIDVRLSAKPDLSFHAKFVGTAPTGDIAVLRLLPPPGFVGFRGPDTMPFIPDTKPPQPDDPVVLLGFPILTGTFLELRCGYFTAPVPDQPYWYATVTVNPGASGSPVITTGEVIAALAEGKVRNTNYLGQTEDVNDTYLLQPVSAAYDLINADTQSTDSTPAVGATVATYDLRAVIDHYFAPKADFVVGATITGTGGASLLGGTTTHLSTVFAPRNSTISNCTLSNTLTSNGSPAECTVDPAGKSATVSYKLNDASLLSSRSSFSGTAMLTIAPN